jgi:hypothetical protein
MIEKVILLTIELVQAGKQFGEMTVEALQITLPGITIDLRGKSGFQPR